jgi:phosphate transport system protein
MADDQAVNQLEVQLDDACSHLIVRRQPAANDLRTVMATIKVITDLERIGDEASKIARTAKSLHERGMVSFNHYDIVRTIGARHRRHAARRARRLRAPGRQAGAADHRPATT